MSSAWIRSQRKTPQIEELFAVVCRVNGIEGVVRRDTPIGTQPWITDDGHMAGEILERAREMHGDDVYLVRFRRVEA